MQRRTTTRALALVAAGLLTVGAAACGDDDDDAADTEDTTAVDDTAADDTAADDTTPDPAADEMATGATVVASGFAFQVPGPVSPGAAITFDNQDGAPHTMTADEGDAFDSGRVDGGAQGEVTAPDAPGDYAFHCEVHPNMTATLTVQ